MRDTVLTKGTGSPVETLGIMTVDVHAAEYRGEGVALSPGCHGIQRIDETAVGTAEDDDRIAIRLDQEGLLVIQVVGGSSIGIERVLTVGLLDRIAAPNGAGGPDTPCDLAGFTDENQTPIRLAATAETDFAATVVTGPLRATESHDRYGGPDFRYHRIEAAGMILMSM